MDQWCRRLQKRIPKLKGYVAARKGEREEMQDAHVLCDLTADVSPLPDSVSHLAYFAVFDGHGGTRASKFAAQNLHLHLARKFPKGEVSNMEKLLKKCLIDTFRQTDEEFLKHASSQKPAWKDGSTATCVLAVDDVLYIANLGDSRAVLCRVFEEENKKITALPLSREHNPTQYEERMRIQKSGGTVRDGRVLGVLEVSRSLGDGQFKRCGVICTPDVRRCQITPNDRFFILACDGLFKVFSPEEAVSFVLDTLEYNEIQTCSSPTKYWQWCNSSRRQYTAQNMKFNRRRETCCCLNNGSPQAVFGTSGWINLEACENEVTELEKHLNKVVKLCSKMVEAGQAYNAANQLLVDGLEEFLQYYKKDRIVMACLSQFNQGLREMIHFHMMLFDQAQRSLIQQLQSQLIQSIPQLKETRREFLRIRDDLDVAIAKNAQVSRNKPQDGEKASHLLLATRKCFQHFVLDYGLQLNHFKLQLKLDILNSVFSYFHAQYTFFHQGYDLLKDLEPSKKKMAEQLAQLTTDVTAKRREVEYAHQLSQQKDVLDDSTNNPQDKLTVEGYLFKRSRKKSKVWNRYWFSIQNNQLVYVKSHKEEPVLLFDDLRLCTVKALDNIERRFSFEVVSVQKSCMLQADTEGLRRAWVAAIQGSIDMAYREQTESAYPQAVLSQPSLSATDVQQNASFGKASILRVVQQGGGNHLCCDCGQPEPRWASINLGITLCIECSGIHRSLGVHLSKVRSVTLDSWEPTQLKLLCVLGNDIINSIYEARCFQEGPVKVTAANSWQEKEAWIKAKYVEKRFVKKPSFSMQGQSLVASQTSSSEQHLGLQLYQAAQEGHLGNMAAALAQGADINWANKEEEGRTPLISAMHGDSLVACEFLLLNGANVNHRDNCGQGALHAATYRGHTGQVCLLLKRGANQYAVDERGLDPLSIAVEAAHADIVTLLRIARMNEEMRDSEGIFGSLGDDETFQEIFRDFTHMASNNPEKLSRRPVRKESKESEDQKVRLEVSPDRTDGEKEEEGDSAVSPKEPA
ncbi:BAR_ACAPs and ArfGap_ACAP domain-containing protein isoform X3 [Polypterus senegalus]|uniref:BAR_ACAPs and ArfGap_ACAP domain-containing protein isoform X3 n=1 Tax=Polypterus senegalus TaxID=55291 RepID=UPI0019635A30|nr:BAR_ACAPs and ArfGap_ACAP domain-containing protein isoform X3 [Polypterus senegalus]